MKIKRMQKAGNIQFVVESYFDKTNKLETKDILFKIMLDMANKQIKYVNKNSHN